MNIASNNLKRLEFEARIFVSLGIVAVSCALSFLMSSDSRPAFVYLAHPIGVTETTLLTVGYAGGALVMTFVTLLRMWAGSILTPTRVMAFRVQADSLKTSGPYRIVRNPIYCADFMAICMFALCLPPVGLVMPVVFFMHYRHLILFEEESLASVFVRSFEAYRSGTPRMIPTPRSMRRLGTALREFRITEDGFRHNALFLLFIPGFIIAATTQEFVYAIPIGLPAVIDWATIHTRIGLKK